MHRVAGAFKYLASSHQYTSCKDNNDKVVVFERGDLVFAFNWNATQSFNDYRIGCRDLTNYKLVLSSDNPEFGGYSNLWTYSAPDYVAEDYAFNGRPASFLAYLPSRTVSVYAPAELANKLLGFSAPTAATTDQE
jgi:1,4-alpha-glucan branching enzyme